jgi:serine/threonine-protein kinase
VSGQVSDEAFAKHLIQTRLVTTLQVDTARQEQAELAKQGVAASLADLLVKHGVITPAIRDNVENAVQARQAGGIQRLGQFKLLKKLGEGGMGAVYLAEDTVMDRKVALKVLPKERANDAAFLTRFRREATAVGRLNHINIVGAYTVGEEMGHHFIVMEYCEGESLDQKLKRAGRLPWDKAVEIAMQVARGLKHAHEHGFIHRDIKPANVIVTPEGVAKILDLGLARSIAESAHLTQTATAVGTPHYMSPEQARGA